MTKLFVGVFAVLAVSSCTKAAGQKCTSGEVSCIGTEYAQCEKGVMAPFECRGSHGCYAVESPAPNQFSCDTSLAVVGEACPVLGNEACAADGGSDLLKCATDGGWAFEKSCTGKCEVTGSSQYQGACKE